MLKTNSDRIARLKCPACGAEISCRYYTQNYGETKFDYGHFCSIKFTIEQLDSFRSTND